MTDYHYPTGQTPEEIEAAIRAAPYTTQARRVYRGHELLFEAPDEGWAGEIAAALNRAVPREQIRTLLATCPNPDGYGEVPDEWRVWAREVERVLRGMIDA